MGLGMSGNDDFFSGSITPPPAPPAPGSQVNPHLAQNKEYGSFGGTTTVKASSSSTQPLVLGAIVLVIALVGFFGYRMYFGSSAIELPDELQGLERLDSDSDAGQATEESWSEFSDVVGGDVEVHVGAYSSGPQTLVVAAAETSDDEMANASAFFEGVEEALRTQLPTATLDDADAGAHGGTMKCLDVTSQGLKTGACAWVDEETFGMVVGGPLDDDIAEVTRQVRDAIQN